MISSVTPSLVNSDSDSGLSEMGSDLFLELLVAQLQNQNPMEPMDGNALLQQTSQLANVEALQELSELQSHIAGLGQFDTAAQMIGHTVTATDPFLGAITGVVTGVRATAAGPVVQIGGREVSVDQIVAVIQTVQDDAAAATPTSVDDAAAATPTASEGAAAAEADTGSTSDVDVDVDADTGTDETGEVST